MLQLPVAFFAYLISTAEHAESAEIIKSGISFPVITNPIFQKFSFFDSYSAFSANSAVNC